MKLRFAFKSVILVLSLLVGASQALAQRGGRVYTSNLRDGREVHSAFTSVVAQANQCTVRVLCGGKEAALGAVVGSDGWIVTKFSELREPVVCRFGDGRQLPARIVGHDPDYDLAMLKVEATELKSVDWDNDDKGPAVGQLLATTATGGLPQAIGVVSVPRRAIPPRAVLGIKFDDFDSRAKIDLVYSGSPAAKAGLKIGDIVTRVDDKLVDTRETLIDLIRHRRPLDVITVAVRRGNDDLKVSATLLAPGDAGSVASRSDRMNAMGGPLSRRASDFPNVIQHDTVLRPSDCGGPVVDLSGKVVGINIARGGRTESYAVPADKVLARLDDLKSGRLTPKTPLLRSTEAKTAAQNDSG